MLAGVKIERGLGSMNCKIVSGPSKLTLRWLTEPADFEATVRPLSVPLAKKKKKKKGGGGIWAPEGPQNGRPKRTVTS